MNRIIRAFSEKNTVRKKHWNKQFFYEFSYEKLSAKKSILDLGCGLGSFLKLGNGNAFGIDSNFESLKQSKRYSKNLVRGSVLQLPFPDGVFDGINCSHLIEHFGPGDAYALLREMNRVLKKDGLIVISTPVMWEKFFDDFTHVKPYNPGAILHYYGQQNEQRTKEKIDCKYEIDEIKWRYARIPIKPILLPRGGLVNTFLILLTEYLGSIGFGRYVKTGYSLSLRKIR